jgi:acyl-CoA thioesterase
MKGGMKLVRAILENDRFASLTGIKLVKVSEGYALARLRITDKHLNGLDIVQGGAVFTLADLAFAAACNSHGQAAVAINVSISFLDATAGGTLSAEAREVALSSKLSTCVVRVTDRRGKLVALFNGTAYRKKETLAEIRASRGSAARTGARKPKRRAPERRGQRA